MAPSTIINNILSLVVILRLQYTAEGCKIMGIDSGFCEYRYLPETYLKKTTNERSAREVAQTNWNCNDESCMPFCGSVIGSYYPFCAPTPNGMFNHTIRSKDLWVENRIEIEIKGGIDEDGRKVSAKKTFHKNKACQDAYKQYACWLNFPRCDEFQDSLPMCSSVCENFFRVCNYPEDLWKCTGSTEEQLFPGAPFKANEYDGRNPKDVCTPSIKGAGITARLSSIMIVGSIALLLLLL